MMQRVVGSLGRFTSLALGAGLSALVAVNAQSLTWIGSPVSSLPEIYPSGVSADGSVVVGTVAYTATPTPVWRAFRWTRREGSRLLSAPGLTPVGAYAVSADGRTVVGLAVDNQHQYTTFIATPETGITRFDFMYNHVLAPDVSADGRTVVGAVYLPNIGGTRVFRWTPATGMQLITDLPSSVSHCEAPVVSADGSIIAGNATYREGDRLRAGVFRWSASTGFQLITDPHGCRSSDISADGSIIVGLRGSFPARWVNGRVESLSLAWGKANAVSADGNIAVGYTAGAVGVYPMRWIGRSEQDLNVVYAALLPNGAHLIEATAISPDGRYIVGIGYTQNRGMAFLLDTWRMGDTNGDARVNDTDLLNVLLAMGTRGTGHARHEDMNKDGRVNDADMLMVLLHLDNRR